jgi:hypothetical protein
LLLSAIGIANKISPSYWLASMIAIPAIVGIHLIAQFAPLKVRN